MALLTPVCPICFLFVLGAGIQLDCCTAICHKRCLESMRTSHSVIKTLCPNCHESYTYPIPQGPPFILGPNNSVRPEEEEPQPGPSTRVNNSSLEVFEPVEMDSSLSICVKCNKYIQEVGLKFNCCDKTAHHSCAKNDDGNFCSNPYCGRTFELPYTNFYPNEDFKQEETQSDLTSETCSMEERETRLERTRAYVQDYHNRMEKLRYARDWQVGNFERPGSPSHIAPAKRGPKRPIDSTQNAGNRKTKTTHYNDDRHIRDNVSDSDSSEVVSSNNTIEATEEVDIPDRRPPGSSDAQVNWILCYRECEQILRDNFMLERRQTLSAIDELTTTLGIRSNEVQQLVQRGRRRETELRQESEALERRIAELTRCNEELDIQARVLTAKLAELRRSFGTTCTNCHTETRRNMNVQTENSGEQHGQEEQQENDQRSLENVEDETERPPTPPSPIDEAPLNLVLRDESQNDSSPQYSDTESIIDVVEYTSSDEREE